MCGASIYYHDLNQNQDIVADKKVIMMFMGLKVNDCTDRITLIKVLKEFGIEQDNYTHVTN